MSNKINIIITIPDTLDSNKTRQKTPRNANMAI